MSDIIKQFIDTSDNIINGYHSSKIPEYFRKQKLDEKRKALAKDIDKLFDNNVSVPMEVLTEYALILFENYKPFGSFKHCRRSIRATPTSAVCIFEFDLNNESKVVVSFDPANDNGSICNINYSLIVNGSPNLSFTDVNINTIYDNNDSGDTLSTADLIRDIKNSTARCIIKDISEYLNSIIYKEV